MKINSTYLKTVIKDKGLKLNWIADRAEIDRSYLYLILTEKRNPSSEVLLRLLIALGVLNDFRFKNNKELSMLWEKT